MTKPPPEPQPATDGQRELTAQERAEIIIAEVNAAMSPAATRHKDDSKTPEVGDAQPVAQPGIPPMDQRLTQIGRLSLYVGCATVPPGLVASLFMVSTGYANPAVLGWTAGAIGSLAIPIGVAGYAIKRALAAAPPPPPTINYTGTVHHHETHNETTVENVNKWGGESSTTVHN